MTLNWSLLSGTGHQGVAMSGTACVPVPGTQTFFKTGQNFPGYSLLWEMLKQPWNTAGKEGAAPLNLWCVCFMLHWILMVGVWVKGFSRVSTGATIWGRKKDGCARQMFLEKYQRPRQWNEKDFKCIFCPCRQAVFSAINLQPLCID